MKYLWYLPNDVASGHRGDDTRDGWGGLDYATELALDLERSGWDGALVGSGWGRPDAMTLGTAVAARTTTFQPLVAVRPGYWQPAQFATTAATFDRLLGERLLVNVVSGIDHLAAYGDELQDPTLRYDRTREFLQIVRDLWDGREVAYRGEHFRLDGATVSPPPRDGAAHPPLYFAGASAPAERVAAEEGDVQLFWGEPLSGIEERIDRLTSLQESVGRRHAPLEYGLRVTTVARATSEEAWRVAEERVEGMRAASTESTWTAVENGVGVSRPLFDSSTSAGQRRLESLASRGEVLDTCLYTTPGTVGGAGASTTWLVGSYDEVAEALRRYQELGVTHFILSDTPYRREAVHLGRELLDRLGRLGTGSAVDPRVERPAVSRASSRG